MAAPKLESLGEIYRGFKRDREKLKAGYGDATEAEWCAAFEELRDTRELYKENEKIVARETMRVLLSVV